MEFLVEVSPVLYPARASRQTSRFCPNQRKTEKRDLLSKNDNYSASLAHTMINTDSSMLHPFTFIDAYLPEWQGVCC